ncbi:MAG: hypothetical protein CMJ64_12905 [Planctomycetaceae bacterium]|jgi:hypothetical protein|nr:hypothetical protein [Planctomycetaceae bacterium]
MNEIQELRDASRRIRKALCIQVGEQARNDLAELIDSLIDRVQQLERTKVDVMPIVPTAAPSSGMHTVR